jgi:NADH-quinone oxidoreductase subunit M
MNPLFAQLLLCTIFLPLVGAILMWVVAPLGREIVRAVALAVTLGTLVLAGQLLLNFPAGGAEFAVTDIPWLAPNAGSVLDVRFSVGLDGLGLWMFGLSALLMVTSVLVSWEAIKDRAPLFYGMLLLLEFGCLGVFTARDLILFYVFFEFTLIPLFFLIGIWGSENRRYAAIKFFLFTFAGSILTFLGLLAIVYWDYTQTGSGVFRFGIADLVRGLHLHPLPLAWQLTVFIALFAGFAIKVPLFPLHTWLPLAHTQAPTAGSVILAGILLKIGVYGFLRFSIPMLPLAAATCMPWLLSLSAIGIIYGALVALAQTDMKRLVAYSSVSHLGYCTLGLFALNSLGVQGGVLQMVNHGLSTGGLFAIVGMAYERYHTRKIADLGGLARRAPWMAFFMVVFTFSSIGVPGLNGFVGEFMVLLGMFQRARTGAPPAVAGLLMVVSVLAVSGVVLGAWYMLSLVRRVFFNPLKEPHVESHAEVDPAHAGHGHEPVSDLCWREILALAPLVVFILWIGLRPIDFLAPMAPALQTAMEPAAAKVQEAFRDHEARAAAEPPGNSILAGTISASTISAGSSAADSILSPQNQE